jgi:hypothetical protein
MYKGFLSFLLSTMNRTTSVTKEISDLEKYEVYLVYLRKSYDKHRNKILTKKREQYAPTERSVGRPRKKRVEKNVELPQDHIEITLISC